MRPFMNRAVRPLACLAALSVMAVAVADVRGADGPDRQKVATARKAGVDFLRTTQADDGSWTSNTQPGITGLVVYGLLRAGVPADDPTVQKGLKHLLAAQKDDGGIYYAKSTHRNYESAIAIMALEAANKSGQYDKAIAGAEKFLRKLQWDEGEGLESSDVAYGGAGYGSKSRPDLSNTAFLLDALKAAGAKADDPAIQKALVFVSRTQNLETEHNTTPYAAKVNDGGFYYTPAAGGSSQAGTTADGGLRSYGSMTYAGLKSMIYAGLTPDDRRVKAALDWIKQHYSVDENPGLGQQGLYYYYHTFAKSLSVLGRDELTDAQGHRHNWRQELAAALIERQKDNGSWVNSADRWYEGDPHLVTAYALMALSYVDPPSQTK